MTTEQVFVAGSLIDVKSWNDFQIISYAKELEEAADLLFEIVDKRRAIKHQPTQEEK
jgi:hypothetical protein